jgi:hypothetical protein
MPSLALRCSCCTVLGAAAVYTLYQGMLAAVLFHVALGFLLGVPAMFIGFYAFDPPFRHHVAALHASAFPRLHASSDPASPAKHKGSARRLPKLQRTLVCALRTLKRYSGKLRRTAKSSRARRSQREHHKLLPARTKRGRRDDAAAAAAAAPKQGYRTPASTLLRRSRSSFSLSFAVFFKCITATPTPLPLPSVLWPLASSVASPWSSVLSSVYFCSPPSFSCTVPALLTVLGCDCLRRLDHTLRRWSLPLRACSLSLAGAPSFGLSPCSLLLLPTSFCAVSDTIGTSLLGRWW